MPSQGLTGACAVVSQQHSASTSAPIPLRVLPTQPQSHTFAEDRGHTALYLVPRASEEGYLRQRDVQPRFPVSIFVCPSRFAPQTYRCGWTTYTLIFDSVLRSAFLDFDLLLCRTPGTITNENLAATVEPPKPRVSPSEQ